MPPIIVGSHTRYLAPTSLLLALFMLPAPFRLPALVSLPALFTIPARYPHILTSHCLFAQCALWASYSLYSRVFVTYI